MVRSLCCEKMGLKKGPWTAEEDQALVSYIQQNGHGNWRALPKQAGLLRCGKSCRLRWINYLRPDIKRGNFSKEEEDTIFQLHERLGNRWSAIAARLPGRTDNEIKNVWHTNLKKKLKHYQSIQCDSNAPTLIKSENPEFSAPPGNNNPGYESVSPQRSSSELSSVTDSSAMASTVVIKQEKLYLSENKFPEIDESFWSEELPAEDSRIKNSEFSRFSEGLEFQMVNNSGTVDDDDDGGMDFWYNLFTRGADVPELPEF